MPIAPLLSRNATSFSPSTANRTGSPSAISSDERQAGTQYCRNKAPIGLPGPICVNNSFSPGVVMSLVLAVGVGIGDPSQESGQTGRRDWADRSEWGFWEGALRPGPAPWRRRAGGPVNLVRRDKATLRQVLAYFAATRGLFTTAGTPEQIADLIEDWFADAIGQRQRR